MKYKYNIPALLLAALVFTTANGISVFEHICRSSSMHSYSLFASPKCEMEKTMAPCCMKMKMLAKKKGCCDHKQFYSKLSIEGFTAKQIQLKSVTEKFIPFYIAEKFYHHFFHENEWTSLPPPDNLYRIKSHLQPSPVSLQIFRC